MKLVALAACVYCVTATSYCMLRLHSFSDNSPVDSTSAVPVETGVPNYIPRFDQPSLNEIFEISPYDLLFPRLCIENYSMLHSYRTLPDDIANPDGKEYLSTDWKNNANEITITIRTYDKTNIFLADPSDPETYDITAHEYSYYYSYSEEISIAPSLVIAAFFSDDISEEIVEKRIHVFSEKENSGFKYKGCIQIICGDYVVSYSYQGNDLCGKALYDIITSSLYFR